MAAKYPFIKFVSVMLRVIWYLQLIFLVVLIILSFLLATKSTLIDLDKMSAFKIQFSKLEIQNSLQNVKSSRFAVYLTNGEGRLHLKGSDNHLVFLRLINVYIDTLTYIFIIYLLQQLFAGLEKGLFFIRENGIYMKKIAYAVLVLALLPDMISYLINLYFASILDINGITFKARYSFDIKTMFLALLIFVIAQVFIKGAEIKEENDLTI